MAAKLASFALSHLARNVRLKSLDGLWIFEGTYHEVGSALQKELANGRGATVTGLFALSADGSLTVFGPFGYSGPGMRKRVTYRGRTLFTIGMPLGPYRTTATGRIRASARGTLKHALYRQYSAEIEQQCGVEAGQVRELAAKILREDISSDWANWAGHLFYRTAKLKG